MSAKRFKERKQVERENDVARVKDVQREGVRERKDQRE